MKLRHVFSFFTPSSNMLSALSTIVHSALYSLTHDTFEKTLLLRPCMLMQKCALVPLAFCLYAYLAVFVPAGHCAEMIRVVYGFDREFPPFSYEESGGEAVGFEIDLVKAIFDQSNITLQLRPLSWQNLQLELASGAITFASGVVRTPQRERLFLFSEQASFPLQIRLFTKVYNRYPSAAMLRGQMVSVEKGSYPQRLLEDFGGINIKPYPTKVDALKALYNDDVTAFCGTMQNTYYYIGKLNYGSITTVGTPLGLTNLHFAANKGRGDIMRLANEGFKRLIASGEYDRLYRKWFVRDLSTQDISIMRESARKGLIPAYTPYGMPPQGASVLTVTGKIFSACTVENAQSNLSVSAIGAAIAKAVSEGEFEFRAALVVSAKGDIIQPSDAELQQLYEFGRGIIVVTGDTADPSTTPMVSQILVNPVIKATSGTTEE